MKLSLISGIDNPKGSAIRREKKGKIGHLNAPWWFLIPALLFYAFVILVPSGRGIGYAFANWDGISTDVKFVGLANFRYFFEDQNAINALRHTMFIAFINMVIQNGLGLLLALGVNSRIKSRNFLRVLFFAPAVFPPIVTAFLWRNLMRPEGALNASLDLLGLHSWTQDWLGNPDVVLWSLIMVLTWQFSGYSMVIFLAGLQSISQEIYEASDIDGADPIRRFWEITRPLLAPAITINLMLSIIGGIKIFDQVYGLTSGGPGTASETITSWMVKNAFFFGQFSYAIALALILTVIVGIISIVQFMVLARNEKSMS